MKEGPKQGQSKLTLQKTLVGKILGFQLRTRFVKTSFENQLFSIEWEPNTLRIGFKSFFLNIINWVSSL